MKTGPLIKGDRAVLLDPDKKSKKDYFSQFF